MASTTRSKDTKDKAYLVIGTAERGADLHVLHVLSLLAQDLNAIPVYAGALATLDEIAMYNRRVHRVRTFEEENREKKTDLYKQDKREIAALIQKQDRRINILKNNFRDITFVTNSELYIPEGLVNDLKVISHLDLSPKFTATPVAPNGNKISGNPLTPRAVEMYRYFNNSCVCPHPILATRLFKKEGINHAYMFSTTGALRFAKNAKRQSESFEHYTHPGAALINISEEGYYFIQRVAVDKVGAEVFALFDGKRYSNSEGVKKVASADRLTAITDRHKPYDDKGVYAAFQLLTGIHKPDTVIDMGDTVDMESLNHHAEKGTGARWNKYLANDIDLLTQASSELKRMAPVASILESNHHEWLTRYVNENPELDGLLDGNTLNRNLFGGIVRWDGPGSHSYEWGDLKLRHGHNDTSVINLAREHIKAVNGHYHTYEEFMDAQRMGCACNMNLPYIRGTMSSWLHQIACAGRYKGVSRLNVKTVLQSKGKIVFPYQGKIIRVTI